MSIWARLRSLLGAAEAEAKTPSDDEAAAADGAAPPTPIIRINRDNDVEAATRLRIAQVERALRSAGEREGESSNAEPPWARGKNRPSRLPSGPGRPHDAAFVLTVVLGSELSADAARLAAGFDCAAWPELSVRLIPLVRNGVTEPGFAAQLTAGERRAFLVYRQEPYPPAGGSGHLGLLIGGPGTRPSDDSAGPKVSDEVQLAPLARALLIRLPDALGVVWNREDKRFRPRDEALVALAAPESG